MWVPSDQKNQNYLQMKTGILALVITAMLLAGPVSAQQNNDGNDETFQTVFGNEPGAVGGYISLGLGNTIIDDNNAFTGQFRLAARLGHSLSIGFAGTGFSDRLYGLNYDRPGLTTEGYSIEGGYGGILIEPVFAPRFPVHLSFPVLIGAGGIALTEDRNNDDWDDWNDWDDWDYDSDNNVLESDAFLVIEPGVELEFNLARYLRMGAGVSYRFTNGITLDGRKDYLMNGLSGTVNLKFGIF